MARAAARPGAERRPFASGSSQDDAGTAPPVTSSIRSAFVRPGRRFRVSHIDTSGSETPRRFASCFWSSFCRSRYAASSEAPLMRREINERELLTQVISERKPTSLLNATEVERTAAEITAAKRLVRDWLLWRWSESYAEHQQKDVAGLIGITEPGLNQLVYSLKLGFATLLAVRDFVDYPLDHILSKPPPARPRRIRAVDEERIATGHHAPPAAAPSSPARPRGRRAGGGR
jgi:hypothetical protein